MAGENKEKSLPLDELLMKLGQPGKYQVGIFLLLALNYFPVCFNHVCMAFFGSTPPHKCVDSSFEAMSQNFSDVEYGKCKTTYSISGRANRSVDCQSNLDGTWLYTPSSDRETTIITEWDLVCDNVYLGKLATTIYFCGVMAGGLAFGHLADFFGRKPIMLVSLYIPIAVGLGVYFVQTYTQFVILRFILGFFIQGLQMSTVSLVMELTVKDYRGMAGAVFECYWGVGVLVMAAYGYLIQSWRYMELAIALPSTLCIFFICVIPESPRWLIMKGRFDDAEKIFRKIASVNKKDFPSDMMEKIRQQGVPNAKGAVTYTALDLMKTKQIRIRSLILFVMWFVTSTGYYGLTFQITNLAGNKYLNFFIGACVEMVAYIAVVYVIKRFGRRKPATFYFLVGGVSCVLAGCMPLAGTSDDLSIVATSFAIIGRFGMGGVFSVMVLYTSELYPTVIRNIGMGSCFFWTRVGGLVAPQILLLGDVTHKSVPLIAFGVLAIIGGLLALFLPETLGRKLPDTIQDAENLTGRGKLPKDENYKVNSEDIAKTNLGYTGTDESYGKEENPEQTKL